MDSIMQPLKILTRRHTVPHTQGSGDVLQDEFGDESPRFGESMSSSSLKSELPTHRRTPFSASQHRQQIMNILEG